MGVAGSDLTAIVKSVGGSLTSDFATGLLAGSRLAAGDDRFPGDLAFMKQGSVLGPSPTERIRWPLQIVTRRFDFFGPYSNRRTGSPYFSNPMRGARVAQRVGPVSWVQTERFQRWLRAMNARKYNVFVSVNAIVSGRRSRTRDAIGAVRHVFLDADHDGPAVLSRVEARQTCQPELRPPFVAESHPRLLACRLRRLVERLQKRLRASCRRIPRPRR